MMRLYTRTCLIRIKRESKCLKFDKKFSVLKKILEVYNHVYIHESFFIMQNKVITN